MRMIPSMMSCSCAYDEVFGDMVEFRVSIEHMFMMKWVVNSQPITLLNPNTQSAYKLAGR